MNDTPLKPNLLLRATTTAAALALAVGLNAAAAYTMGSSGTPNGHAQHLLVADLGTMPAITVRACRANG